MSYCVNCGVELDASASFCPLCHTPVSNPAQPADQSVPPFFSPNRVEVAPVSKRELSLLLTAMLLSVSVCCAILNLFLLPELDWYLYAVGASVMLWVWFVTPLLKKTPVWARLTLDVVAVGIYIFLISLATEGDWFDALALPILAIAAILVFGLSFLLRDRRRSTLSSIALSIGTAGLFALGVEFCADRYFTGSWQPGWSLVVLTICVALTIPLTIVRWVPSLREEARRHFHL